MAVRKKTAAAAVDGKETKAVVTAPEVKEEAPKAAEAEKEAASAAGKAPAKKAPARKTSARKAPVKTPAAEAPAKTPAPKKEIQAAVYVQYAGREAAVQDLLEAAKQAYIAAGHKEEDIETINVYVKPEENAAYYTVNGEGSDDFKIVY